MASIELLEKYKENLINIKKSLENEEKSSLDGKLNVFTLISDLYKRENLHSDILQSILDPRKGTNKFGKKEIFNTFLEFIELSETEKMYFNNLEEIEVLREFSRIDILVKNSKYAIIIENKINNASDQPDQLIRYYKKISDEGLDVIKIAYISLFSGKRPNFNQYSDELKNLFIEKKVEDKIIYIAVNTGDKKLVTFIENAIGKLTSNDLMEISILGQYKELLQYLGDLKTMEESEINLIRKIFENQEMENIQTLINTCSNRGTAIYELIKTELLTTEIKNRAFKVETKFGTEVIIKEKKECDESIYLCPVGSNLQIGFVHDNYNQSEETREIQNKNIEQLKNLNSNSKYNFVSENVGHLKNWVYRDFSVDKLAFTQIKDTILELFKELSDSS